MNKQKIMVVSASLTPETINLSNSSLLDPTFVSTDEEGIEMATRQVFDAVVIDAKDESINKRKLYALLPVLQPDVALLGYTGESALVLERRLAAIFRQQQQERIRRFLILDSSLTAFSNSLPPFSVN